MHRKKILLSLISSLILVQNTFANQGKKNLGEITVFAQKVEENLQEVPISISVLDEFSIEDNNIKSLSDIVSYIPNLNQIDIGSGMFTPTMRGLMTDGHTFNTSVGTYVDGVAYINSVNNNLVLDDIERIEVLKGPQGTLYGKGAYAGVINIITKKPDNEIIRKIKIELGEDKKREVSLKVSGPIVEDKFYASLAAKHYKKEGQIYNEYLNTKDDDKEYKNAKLHLRYTPSDQMDISLITSYLKRDDGANPLVLMTDTTPNRTSKDLQGTTTSDNFSTSLKIEYDMDNMKLSSITTYKDYSDKRTADMDFSNSKIVHQGVDSDYKDYSQEFRLSGETRSLKWLTGLYLDKGEENPYYLMNDADFVKSKIENKSIAIFSNLDYKIKENLILSGGIRFGKDYSKIDDSLYSYYKDKSYNEVSPKIGLRYLFNDNLMTYANISKGYKKGGYYIFPSANRDFDKETLWNYELGFKSRSLDNKLTFNMALFYMDIKDMQVLTYLDAINSYISNAAESRAIGFEIDSNYEINRNINIFANFGYTKTEFDEYKDYRGNYSGNENPNAPKFNYSVGLKYRADNGLFGKFDINGQSSFYTDNTNQYKSDAYALANVKIGYETNNYEIFLYSNNITNENNDLEYYAQAYKMLGNQRETGISLVYRF